MHERKYVIELLPYSKNCLLFDLSLRKRVISLLSYLLEEMLIAIDNFYAKNFLSFDPHVGENLCQIRAVQLSDINNSKNNIVKSIERLSFVSEKETVEIFNHEEKECILSSFLNKLQINIEISSVAYYLFLCHFLTKFRTFNLAENTVIDYEKLINEVKISKNLARKVIHEYQKNSLWSQVNILKD